jgi:hypothetical protein
MTEDNKKDPNIIDYLVSINETKEDIMTAENEARYEPFKVNHMLGGHYETVMYAHDMNMYPNLDHRMQYDYLRYSIRSGTRRAKWLKNEMIDDLKLVQKYYGYNRDRAREALKILSVEELAYIKRDFDSGGTEK